MRRGFCPSTSVGIEEPPQTDAREGEGIRKIGYYLFQPANPTIKIQGLEARGSIEDDLVEGTSGGSV